jgi:hypothetical protein
MGVPVFKPIGNSIRIWIALIKIGLSKHSFIPIAASMAIAVISALALFVTLSFLLRFGLNFFT